MENKLIVVNAVAASRIFPSAFIINHKIIISYHVDSEYSYLDNLRGNSGNQIYNSPVNRCFVYK